MYTACGRLKKASHFVQSSEILPPEYTTTRLCSQRASTPTLPLQCLSESSGKSPGAPPPGKLATGPCDAFRNGTSPVGKERLGPNCGIGVFKGRFKAGNSPRCAMKTRFGLSAKIPSTAPHVQLSCPGREVKGFGQSVTASYGPVMSSPPIWPGTAGKAEIGFACACTRCILLATSKPATNPAAVITMSASVTVCLRIGLLRSRPGGPTARISLELDSRPRGSARQNCSGGLHASSGAWSPPEKESDWSLLAQKPSRPSLLLPISRSLRPEMC